MSPEQARHAEQQALLARGEEIAFGDAAALPWPAEELAALDSAHPAVRQVLDGGLTARVVELATRDGRRFALKQARAEPRVRNLDGRLSFLNELLRHRDLRGAAPGLVQPLYGSLRHGFVLSPWIEGRSPDLTEPRAARALFAAALTLLRHGAFEWDFAAGNLLDDGEQVWLFDFGYCYRFDPLRQFNSAGATGTEHREFHVVERIESRNLFGALLDDPEPLPGFLRFRAEAQIACAAWRDELRARGAAAFIVDDWSRRLDTWADQLANEPETLFREAARTAHHNDVDDDLRGRSCTPRTLRRIDWLLAHARSNAERDTLQQQRRQAQAWQLP